jgi:predicted sulfurtransferase
MTPALNASHQSDSDDSDSSELKKKAKAKAKKEKKQKKKEKKEKKKRKRNLEEETATAESKEAEERNEKKKEKKKRKRDQESLHSEETEHQQHQQQFPKYSTDDKIIESSHLDFRNDVTLTEDDLPGNAVSLLLFYQYVEPVWSNDVYKEALKHVERLGHENNVTGRMRVAKEGLNCTLTGARQGIFGFCRALREWKPDCFGATEFKVTHHLPEPQRFGNLKMMPVTELVNYGLDGAKAPPIQQYHGTHLEPMLYHEKIAQANTVIIDVRNHYEATIGHFEPPPSASATATGGSDSTNAQHDNGDDEKNPPVWLNPKMRKSTEFPAWLDDPATQQQLQGKQVLMYCTGGIRCERASALLKYKMATDPATQQLNIQGVYQLQGGIDKYFKEFPDGGYWKGKNYTFDKRNAHAPPAIEAAKSAAHDDNDTQQQPQPTPPVMGKCAACSKAWDEYRGKQRCPTCGVPSLICRDCWHADQDGKRKLDRSARCELCVDQDIRSKKDLRAKEQDQTAAYEARLEQQGLLRPSEGPPPPNLDAVTRLYLKNMCRKSMSEQVLLEHFPDITHIVWRNDRHSGKFLGQAWVEMASPDAAAHVVAQSGLQILGRPLYAVFDPSGGKDAWPPGGSGVGKH